MNYSFGILSNTFFLDETILISNVHPLSLALDVESQMIYWTDINNTIRRSNMNGSNEETLIADSLSEPDSLVLDTRNGFVLHNNESIYHNLMGLYWKVKGFSC